MSAIEGPKTRFVSSGTIYYSPITNFIVGIWWVVRSTVAVTFTILQDGEYLGPSPAPPSVSPCQGSFWTGLPGFCPKSNLQWCYTVQSWHVVVDNPMQVDGYVDVKTMSTRYYNVMLINI